jgi:hypothetical protein
MPNKLSSLLTEEGNSWTVMVFRCTVDEWGRILTDLFELIDNIEEGCLPHYKVSAAIPRRILFISFRVLRDPIDENLVKKVLNKYALKNGIDYSLDPKKGEKYGNYHNWIRHSNKVPKWVRERCQALTHLSRLAILLSKNKILDFNVRRDMVHLAVNMLGMREATTLESQEAYFRDFITGGFVVIPKAAKKLSFQETRR